MKTARVLAVDFGASGGKCFAGLFGDEGFRLQEVHRFSHEATSFFMPDHNGRIAERTYWDDTLLFQNVVKGLREYRRGVAETLDSIGIDTWGADGQFMTADGDAMGKMYAYRDHRLDTMIDAVKARINARRMYSITGIHFQPFNLSNQLHWFMLNRKKALGPGAFYLPVPSLFYYYLGGVRKVDSTWASVTQLMDAQSRTWSETVLRKLKIPLRVMPEIVAPGTVVGELYPELARTVGLNSAKLIAVGGHDTASAFAAAPVANQDEALIISSGTWSLVGKLVPEPITTRQAMDANLSNEGGIGNVRLLKNCMGTWLVQELKRVWQQADGRDLSWAEMDRWTLAAPAFSAFVDPDDPAFYNPPDMQAAIVDFCRRTGQGIPSDRGTFLRMVYESLALKYRMVNEVISKVSGKPSKVVHIVGGGCKNIMLNQYAANAIGLPVIAGPEEATAVGNCMVQAMGLGVIGSLQDALALIRQAFPIREYMPQDSGRWNEAYATFRKLVR
jgi:sugar (pentulose or hexulose) kinase